MCDFAGNNESKFCVILTARRFDFFDMGMMEGLQYRLKMAESVSKGPSGIVTFNGHVASRRTVAGAEEFLIRWNPSNM